MSNTSGSSEAEAKLIVYAEALLRGYVESIEKNFSETSALIRRRGLGEEFFPLYGREVGKTTTLAGFFTAFDFYLFFLGEAGRAVRVLREGSDPPTYDRDWTSNTPHHLRVQQVKREIGIEETQVLQAGTDLETVCIPGTNFMASSLEEMKRVGYQHGTNFGNQAGLRADRELPRVLEDFGRAEALSRLENRYAELRDSTLTPQARGQEFEQLWRDVLDLYGWKPKKFRIAGEENDLTAIYKGLHILGEVRWFSDPMTGGKLREFLGKLDPRPQTIGLFISHSGLDDGTWGVVRRAANSKTVVVFDAIDIAAVFLAHSDPGPRFDEKLREAYDYIFEKGQ